jgi:hypothetical protein
MTYRILRAVSRWGMTALLFGSLPLATRAARAAEMTWSDYQAKGEIQIAVQDVNMSIQMEQTFRRPSTMLLSLDVLGLKQMILMDGTVEQTYNPAQGLLIERRYLNLEKSEVNPMVGAQTSMEDLGRRIREAKSAQVVGKESLIGFECDLYQLDTKELMQRLAAGGVLSSKRIQDQLGPTVKAWICREYGIPVKVEIAGTEGKASAMTFKFTELKVNTGVGKEALSLSVPRGTQRVSVTADLSDPEWEPKLESSLRKALEEKAKSSKSSGKGG